MNRPELEAHLMRTMAESFARQIELDAMFDFAPMNCRCHIIERPEFPVAALDPLSPLDRRGMFR